MNSTKAIKEFLLFTSLCFSFLTYGQQSQDSDLTDEQCTQLTLEKISKQRKANFQKLEIRSKLPDIQLNFQNNNTIFLSQLEFEFVLLVFWGSECDVCEMILPQFINLYNTYDSLGFEIVGISMDDNLEAWQNSIDKNGYPWKNHCDGLGWNGPIAEEYNIFGTPTILLLNKDLEIADFPKSINEIQEFLYQNLINHQIESD